MDYVSTHAIVEKIKEIEERLVRVELWHEGYNETKTNDQFHQDCDVESLQRQLRKCHLLLQRLLPYIGGELEEEILACLPMAMRPSP